MHTQVLVKDRTVHMKIKGNAKDKQNLTDAKYKLSLQPKLG